MSKIILCAMGKEADNILIPNACIYITGIGCINVIKTLSRLIKRGEITNKDEIINVGYAGSSSLPIGSVVTIHKCSRLNASHTVKEPTFKLKKAEGLDFFECKTADDFVEKYNGKKVIDMELAYICSFFSKVTSIKIISDNENYCEYEEFDSKESWKTVNKILKGIINAD